jgi:zinc transport system ATP-binding protein
MSNSLIDLDNISVLFGAETAVKQVSFCVHAGEFIGLIGPNGAGKSTLLKVILGLQMPSKGRVRKDATSVIGYIPQRGDLGPIAMPISALEVVMLGSRGSKQVALRSLEAVHMADVAKKRFNDLSGGQQQRVFIAKALASDPNVLILDEPTTGIDERSQTEFYDILRDLQHQGMTIVMVSHDVDTVLRLVTRVVCLNQTIVYDGPPQHFESDKYLPSFFTAQHRQLHHHHGGQHA